MVNDKEQIHKNMTFNQATITSRLANELPNWFYEDGHIQRKFRTAGWKSTLMVVNAIGHLAEVAWHHPEINASYSSVIVKLMNHEASGVTEKDFELAKKIEEFVNWQPALDDGALDGTPDDPRFRYLRYD